MVQLSTISTLPTDLIFLGLSRNWHIRHQGFTVLEVPEVLTLQKCIETLISVEFEPLLMH